LSLCQSTTLIIEDAHDSVALLQGIKNAGFEIRQEDVVLTGDSSNSMEVTFKSQNEALRLQKALNRCELEGEMVQIRREKGNGSNALVTPHPVPTMQYIRRMVSDAFHERAFIKDLERAGIEVAEALQSMRENLIPPASADAFHERAFKEDWDRAGFEVAETLQQPLRKNIITPASVGRPEDTARKQAKQKEKRRRQIEKKKVKALEEKKQVQVVAPKEGDERKGAVSKKKEKKNSKKGRPTSKAPQKGSQKMLTKSAARRDRILSEFNKMSSTLKNIKDLLVLE